jgi:hypothetical protein
VAWVAAVGVYLAPWAASAQLPGQPDPQQLQPTIRAPLTLTPSLTVSEEYNDNILSNNRDKRHDFITGLTPGVTLTLEDPLYRLSLGYDFTAEIYARDPDRNAAFNRHNFALDTFYRVSPLVTLSLTDSFAFSTDTNLIAAEGVSTGRDRAWSNTVTPGLSWQVTPLTTLRLFGSNTVQRFDNTALRESDVYKADVSLEHRLSPRLSGVVGYQFGYFDIEREDVTTVHTPRLGATYRFTESLTGSAAVGPSVVLRSGDSKIVPTAAANATQRLRLGSVGVFYEGLVGTAGGLGGTTLNQSFGGSVEVTTLMRGLVVDVGPRYSTIDSIHNDSIDVDAFRVPLRARYRFTEWMTGIASYTFFRQRADTTVRANGSSLANDVDQNRVYVGLQFGYPIRRD